MKIALAKPGQMVRSGDCAARFLRLSGTDALVELTDGRRVVWSHATEVEVYEEQIQIRENYLPRLEARLAELEQFAVGKYAQLGLAVTTPCTPVKKQFHAMFIRGALGERPADAIVCRRCSTKLCVRADHLFWGTRSDCQRDMCLRGVARPSGRAVSAFEVAKRIIRLRSRVAKLRRMLDSQV